MTRMASVLLGLMIGVAPTALLAQASLPSGGSANGATVTQALAQPSTQSPGQSPAPADDASDDDSIVVRASAQRLPGAVMGDIKPELQLGPSDIRSYGVSSVSELLNELAPETRSDRGRGGSGGPVVLLNGRRISGFSEIQDIPTEAIARVDILPEEVALKYGYSADQRIVNIVLRPRFRAYTGEARGGMATDGGGVNGQGSVDYLRIRRDTRFNLDLKYQASDSLFESERGILPVPPARPYDLLGNITAPRGAASNEIDPALSALAGMPVTVAGVPASAVTGAPSLVDFLPGANIANVSNLGQFRTLSPRSSDFSANMVYSRPIFGNVSATFNGRLELTDSLSSLGLPSASLLLPAGNPFSPFADDVTLYRYLGQLDALTQSGKATTVHAGLTLDSNIGAWRWNFTGVYDLSDSRTRTATGINPATIQSALNAGDPLVNPFGGFAPGLLTPNPADRATARSSAGGVDLLLSGPLFALPAGNVTTSIRLGGQASDFTSDSLRSGIARSSRFSRDTGSGQLNLDVPIASRKGGVLPAIGDLSVNGNVAVQHLSDFGTLTTIGYGLHWTPIKPVSFIFSSTTDHGAPSTAQLGNPQLVTPNVPVFDYVTGTTVYVSQIGGGNPTLRDDTRHVIKLGITIKPISNPDLTISGDYVRSRTSNLIASFPNPTAAIEAAFPDRFMRDASGTLLQVDGRPVNFQRAESDELRWGVNFSRALKSNRQALFDAWRRSGGGGRPDAGIGGGGSQGAADTGGRGGAGGRGPGGGGFGGRGFGGGGGRLQFALYHTWHFRDTILIRDGVPVLDLLNGGATGPNGGQSRHELEGQAGLSKNGLGARVSANWQSATSVAGSPLSPGSDLHFSDLATFNLRLFANMGQMPELIRKYRWLRGSRVTLSVNNLLDSRQQVTDGTGATPLRYQPAYLDPMGRTISISFRKMLF